MDDLIARIRAAIDEDERIAKAAVNWSYGAQEWADAGEPDWVHIARHDPARVLRQVAAHRKILDIVEQTRAIETNASERIRSGTHTPTYLRDWNDAQRELAVLQPILEILAETYGIEP